MPTRKPLISGWDHRARIILLERSKAKSDQGYKGWGGVRWGGVGEKKIRDTSFVYIDQLQRRSRNDKRQGIVNAEKFHTNQNIQKQNKVDRPWVCFGLHLVLIFFIVYDFLQPKESQDGYFDRIFKTMCDNVQVCNKVLQLFQNYTCEPTAHSECEQYF